MGIFFEFESIMSASCKEGFGGNPASEAGLSFRITDAVQGAGSVHARLPVHAILDTMLLRQMNMDIIRANLFIPKTALKKPLK
jgi:hypothetical protein